MEHLQKELYMDITLTVKQVMYDVKCLRRACKDSKSQHVLTSPGKFRSGALSYAKKDQLTVEVSLDQSVEKSLKFVQYWKNQKQ